MAHEIGHNLVGDHDQGICFGNNYQIMAADNPGVGYKWSYCTKTKFKDLYLSLKNSNDWCMEGKLVTLVTTYLYFDFKLSKCSF